MKHVKKMAAGLAASLLFSGCSPEVQHPLKAKQISSKVEDFIKDKSKIQKMSEKMKKDFEEDAKDGKVRVILSLGTCSLMVDKKDPNTVVTIANPAKLMSTDENPDVSLVLSAGYDNFNKKFVYGALVATDGETSNIVDNDISQKDVTLYNEPPIIKKQDIRFNEKSGRYRYPTIDLDVMSVIASDNVPEGVGNIDDYLESEIGKIASQGCLGFIETSVLENNKLA